MKKVFIVGSSFRGQFISMYTGRGYEIVQNLADADIVQFTGGADISPHLYNQHEHHTVYTSPSRDEEEVAAYREAQALGKFCAGVCRGAQLINALNGGMLYQDVSNHATGAGHLMLDVLTKEKFNVSSLHHQMCKVTGDAIILGISADVRSPAKRYMTQLDAEASEIIEKDDNVEIESAFYPATRSFIFQPHPEFVEDKHPCRNYYFKMLEKCYAGSPV